MAAPSLLEIFGHDGALQSALFGFQARPGQTQMAQFVERGLLEGMHSIVEAGTGTGKSLAYLIPALRSGKKIVVSTGTIALQEQLVGKDIPLAAAALGMNVRITLLKGRNHYLCKQKFERIRTDRLVAESASMEKMWQWGGITQTGDRSELPFVPSGDEWEKLDADADDCVGEHCSHFADCFFFRKRDEAKTADIVVVNHALFFLDLASGGTLLPAYDVAILDEAHQCERWATAALTSSLSRTSINRMLRKVRRAYDIPSHIEAEIDQSMRSLESSLVAVPGDRYPLAANDAAPAALAGLRAKLFELENWIHAHLMDKLRVRTENESEAQRRRDLTLRSIVAQTTAIERANAPGDAQIAWVERNEGLSGRAVCAAPFDISDFLRTTLFARVPSVVLASATLAANGSFAYVHRSLGLDDAQEFIAPSPFDYSKQACLYLAPADFNPKDPRFARKAAPIIEECLERTRGRAFVLFTSYARLNEVYALLRERLAFPVKLQGELPRPALLRWFRETPGAVLFATGTFWEGIDVAGEALSCVIIDRLPFPSPQDPIVAAKMRDLQERGLDAFESYMIPAATVRLKQGFGRLIRSLDDRGVVAILDGRAISTRYGAAILNELPAATRITDLSRIAEFLSP